MEGKDDPSQNKKPDPPKPSGKKSNMENADKSKGSKEDEQWEQLRSLANVAVALAARSKSTVRNLPSSASAHCSNEESTRTPARATSSTERPSFQSPNVPPKSQSQTPLKPPLPQKSMTEAAGSSKNVSVAYGGARRKVPSYPFPLTGPETFTYSHKKHAERLPCESSSNSKNHPKPRYPLHTGLTPKFKPLPDFRMNVPFRQQERPIMVNPLRQQGSGRRLESTKTLPVKEPTTKLTEKALQGTLTTYEVHQSPSNRQASRQQQNTFRTVKPTKDNGEKSTRRDERGNSKKVSYSKKMPKTKNKTLKHTVEDNSMADEVPKVKIPKDALQENSRQHSVLNEDCQTASEPRDDKINTEKNSLNGKSNERIPKVVDNADVEIEIENVNESLASWTIKSDALDVVKEDVVKECEDLSISRMGAHSHLGTPETAGSSPSEDGTNNDQKSETDITHERVTIKSPSSMNYSESSSKEVDVIKQEDISPPSFAQNSSLEVPVLAPAEIANRIAKVANDLFTNGSCSSELEYHNGACGGNDPAADTGQETFIAVPSNMLIADYVYPVIMNDEIYYLSQQSFEQLVQINPSEPLYVDVGFDYFQRIIEIMVRTELDRKHLESGGVEPAYNPDERALLISHDPPYTRPDLERPSSSQHPPYARPDQGRPSCYQHPPYVRPDQGRPSCSQHPLYARPDQERPPRSQHPPYARPHQGRPSCSQHPPYVRLDQGFVSQGPSFYIYPSVRIYLPQPFLPQFFQRPETYLQNSHTANQNQTEHSQQPFVELMYNVGFSTTQSSTIICTRPLHENIPLHGEVKENENQESSRWFYQILFDPSVYPHPFIVFSPICPIVQQQQKQEPNRLSCQILNDPSVSPHPFVVLSPTCQNVQQQQEQESNRWSYQLHYDPSLYPHPFILFSPICPNVQQQQEQESDTKPESPSEKDDNFQEK